VQENAASATVAAAMAEVEALRESAARQQKAVDDLISQRELYRAIRSPGATGDELYTHTHTYIYIYINK